jgi:NADPH2 dehydrogenase
MGDLVMNSGLFTPLKIGNMTLQHRVVMAPLGRSRSTKKEHVPNDYVTTYYQQRASVPGTLLITEATLIAPQAGGYDFVPGIWSKEQIAAWKKVRKFVLS